MLLPLLELAVRKKQLLLLLPHLWLSNVSVVGQMKQWLLLQTLLLHPKRWVHTKVPVDVEGSRAATAVAAAATEPPRVVIVGGGEELWQLLLATMPSSWLIWWILRLFSQPLDLLLLELEESHLL